MTIFLVYVDILAARNNDCFINTLIHQLGKEFAIKDLYSLWYFLRVEKIPFFEGYFSLKLSIFEIFLNSHVCLKALLCLYF